MKRAFIAVAALAFAGSAWSQNTPYPGGGASSITPASTPFACGTDGSLAVSNAGKIDCAGAAKATSIAIAGATIGADGLAVTGTGVTSGNFRSSAGSIGSSGNFLAGSDFAAYNSSANALAFGGTGRNGVLGRDVSGVLVSSDWRYMWGSAASGNTDVFATQDTGLSRISAGVVGIGNGTASDHSAQIYAGTLRSNATTVAGLPAAATAGVGSRAFVTDAVACTLGGALTGGGSTPCPVYSTGSAWLGG